MWQPWLTSAERPSQIRIRIECFVASGWIFRVSSAPLGSSSRFMVRKGLYERHHHTLENLGSVESGLGWSCLEGHSLGSSCGFHRLLCTTRCAALSFSIHAG